MRVSAPATPLSTGATTTLTGHRVNALETDAAGRVIGVGAELVAGRDRANWNGYDDLVSAARAQGSNRRQHRRARGQAVVHHDDGSSQHGDWLARAAEQGAAPLDFSLGLFRHRVDLFPAEFALPNQGRVQDAYSSFGDGTQGELGLPGDAQLANQANVEFGPQCVGDLAGDGDTAPRQPDDEEVLFLAERLQLNGQQLSGVASIAKHRSSLMHVACR